MKKIYKGMLLASSLGVMAVTLASCGGSSRNTTVPYEGKYNSDSVIATATNDKNTKETSDDTTMSMTMSQFYSRLRYQGYSTVTQAIREQMYKVQYTTIKKVLENKTLAQFKAAATQDEIDALLLGDLYTLEGKTLDYTVYTSPADAMDNYEYIRKNLCKAINKNLSSAIFSTVSYETIEKMKDEDIAVCYNKFIEAKSRLGITVTKAQFDFTEPTDDSDLISFDLASIVKNNEDVIKSYLVTQAETLSSKKALYEIAGQEYIIPYDSEDNSKTKNSNYLFEDSKLESAYDSTIATYGKYHAVIVQFDTRREAVETIAKLENEGKIDFSDPTDTTKIQNSYLELYKYVYSYKASSVSAVTDDDFYFSVTPDKNDLNDLSSSVSSFITDTLEDGDYLTEARNVNNKYVMIYRIDTVYDNAKTNGDAKKYDDLSADEKAKYNVISKFASIESNAASYSSTNYKSILYKATNSETKDDDLVIYDPLFEFKFYNSYSDVYNLMDAADFKDNLIFRLGSYEYTVSDFYKEASLAYGTTIITNYFELEYCLDNFKSEYVDEDDESDNSDTIDSAIKAFNNGENSTYPAEVGEKVFLLGSYGYETKDDILKYYYNATSCLNKYIAKTVFEEWAKEENGKNVINTEKIGILNNILESGNSTYSTLFNINLDHILINIDADGDGSPDDPKTFTKDMTDVEKKAFENAVQSLARVIYTEAISGKYGKENSLYEILSYIKTQYEEGATLKSDTYNTTNPATGKNYTWDDFKTYPFQLTVEQLASSSDITQDSVSNFVETFADYVKNVYKMLNEQDVDMTNYKKGVFYVYNTADETKSTVLTKTDASDKESITIDSLCYSSFGYHFLVVNSYEGPESTKYTVGEDDYQANLPIILKNDSDTTDDVDDKIVVYTDSANDQKDQANYKQLFIYYVQKRNGATTSLDSNIATLMGTMFDSVIEMYASTNFQNFLLLGKLKIHTVDTDASLKLLNKSNGLDTSYYANLVTNYGKDNDKYLKWVDGTYDWTRPSK